MAQKPVVMISFKDMESQEPVRERLERGCHLLSEEFPETTRYEFTLAADGAGHTVHGHVTGRNTDVATHAEAMDALLAADQVLEKLERKLRRLHEKHIFVHRREAQRENHKRRH
jgi:ribosome-associated translation inhibitor RaiA